MAKRRKLEVPNQEDLSKLEAEFRSETSLRPTGITPPIAQVAAEAARGQSVVSTEVRAQVAKDQVDAQAYRDAIEQGLVVEEIALDSVDADDLMRDRTVFDEEEMKELESSIEKSGLRLPIEVYELPTPRGEAKYGLISGYRRLLAVRALFLKSQDLQYRMIKAFVRPATSLPKTLSAMVEENEIRANLSHFERGRLIGLTVQNGIFQDIDAAVAALFNSASKAKRSKIRSFALVFDELGDVLSFPETLSERLGLKLAQTLKLHGSADFRRLLSDANCVSPDEEHALIQRIIQVKTPSIPHDTVSTKSTKSTHSQSFTLQNGIRVSERATQDNITFTINAAVSDELRDKLRSSIAAILEKADQ